MTEGGDGVRVAGGAPVLTVGVATRNRPDSLARCLGSLRLLEGIVAEAVVVDDASEPPVEGPVRAALPAGPPPLRFIRNEQSRNASAGRNRIAREAATPFVLNLDDDAFIVTRQAVELAVRVMAADPEVGAVAFAQCDEAGDPFSPAAQPAPVDYPCYIPAFIGFAHLLRREAFLAVGGYLERLGQNGEEKELCLRLLDAGFRVVYLPQARIGHVADPGGRDLRRYLRQVVRNDVLGALNNEPFPLVIGGAAYRLWRYFPMRRGWKIHDPGGFGAIVRELGGAVPRILRERRPVRLATFRRWRAMVGAAPEPYAVSGTPDAPLMERPA